jgi:hypothetical protein
MTIIKTLLALVLCLASGLSHANNNYQDWWWNPAQSGMGLNVGQQNDTIFVAWFNYGDDSKASFLTMGGVLSGNTLTGTLFRGTGPVPGPNYNPALVKQTAVGTASITFNSNTDATLTYSYDNKSGSMPLQRFSFASPNLNQTWTVVQTYTKNNCANPSLNESITNVAKIKGQQGAGNNFTFTITDLDGANRCIAALAFQPAGSRGVAVGTATCYDGSGANVTFDDMSVQAGYLNLSYTLTNGTEDRSCIQKGNWSGIAQKETLTSYDYKTAFQNRILQGASKTFNVTGDCKGTFSITDSPAAKTTWNGQAAYAVQTTEIVNMPNCSLNLGGSQSNITYYDMNFVEIAKTHSNGTYSEYAKSSQPISVKVGETGTLGTWTHWNNTSKSSKLGSDVHSYSVEPDSTTSVIFNLIDRAYDNNQLEVTSQIRFRLNAAETLSWFSATVDIANNMGRLDLQ